MTQISCKKIAKLIRIHYLCRIEGDTHPIPRNPNIIKFFRYAKLGENAGYGIDKMLVWEQLTNGKVEFTSDLVSSTITYRIDEQATVQVSGQASGQVSGTVHDIEQTVNQGIGQTAEQVSGTVSEPVQLLINTIRERAFGISDLQVRLKIKSRRYIHESMLTPAIEGGYVLRAYPEKPSHPQQRYYLSEKGLKLVKK